jgi:hypothetical protein
MAMKNPNKGKWAVVRMAIKSGRLKTRPLNEIALKRKLGGRWPDKAKLSDRADLVVESEHCLGRWDETG